MAAISDEVGRVLASAAFASWAQGEKLQADDLVLINNSFLFRGGQSTVKNDKCLAVTIGADGAPGLPPVVAEHGRFNSQFKRSATKRSASVTTVDLALEVEAQTPRLGSIVFALAGRIGADETAETPFGVSSIDVLAYDPAQEATAISADRKVTINCLDDIDFAWDAVRAALNPAEDVRESVAEKFEPAFQSLQEAAKRPVDISDVAPDAQSILSNVIERVEEQVQLYGRHLAQHKEHPEDGETYNELLRVAYNFADGATLFINLVVGVCDLKPLLFWLTVAEQIELAERFARLPFALVGKAKPSLERYRAVISNARNQSFHDVFAFDRSFRVRLQGDAFRSAELHLFREHASRNDPALDFEDRKLVDVLKGFTRANVRPVPLGFWDGNLLVMQAILDLAQRVREALILLAPARLVQ